MSTYHKMYDALKLVYDRVPLRGLIKNKDGIKSIKIIVEEALAHADEDDAEAVKPALEYIVRTQELYTRSTALKAAVDKIKMDRVMNMYPALEEVLKDIKYQSDHIYEMAKKAHDANFPCPQP